MASPGGTAVSTAASRRQRPRFDSRLGSLSVWSLHILPVSAWVSSRSSASPPNNLKEVLVRCIGHAKFSLSVPEQVPECDDQRIFTVTSLSVNVSLLMTVINKLYFFFWSLESQSNWRGA